MVHCVKRGLVQGCYTNTQSCALGRGRKVPDNSVGGALDKASRGSKFVLGLSEQIGTLPTARDRDTLLRLAVGSVLGSQWHKRIVDFKLVICMNITSCAACREVGDNFLFAIDLSDRHHSAVTTKLWRQGSALRKGNLGEGGEGEEGVECRNGMITKNINR